MSGTLLAWSQDAILANRSGYHVLADYLIEERVTVPRRDATSGWPRLLSRLRRQFSFSRWCTTGSFDLEAAIKRKISTTSSGAVHYLWCDRDLAFLDLSLRQDLKLIGTFHQCPDDLPKAIRRSSALKKFAAIIVMSHTQRRFFEQHGVKPERVHRLLHGVDVDYFTPGSLEATEDFRVLAVGGTRRDFPQMQAVAEALRDKKHIHFDFLGPPDKRHYFQSQTNVRYHSSVNDAELLGHYRSASCFLHLVENATANNAMLEALACGAPVIGQRVGGIPEYVTQECAVLTEQGDISAVVQSIKDLTLYHQRQADMRAAARAHALTLDWNIIAGHTRQLYHSLA